MDTYTYIICHMYIYIYVIIYIYVYIPWCCKQFVIPTSPSTFWDPIIWSWISESRHIRTMVFRALGYALYSIIHSLNIRISKYTNWYFRLPPGRVSWPARPFQHTESNCLHIHLNIRIELVFHTTSGASRSRPPSTYLNVVTVLLHDHIPLSYMHSTMYWMHSFKRNISPSEYH
jgi:hypothetical protein